MKLKRANTLLVSILPLLHFASSKCSPDGARPKSLNFCDCAALNCMKSKWSPWSDCSHSCGTLGERTRSRYYTGGDSPSCNIACGDASLQGSEGCNRHPCRVACKLCYTKVGTRCELRQCKIGGQCFPYGRKNPSNQCQECRSSRKGAWTNINGVSCDDRSSCTKNDKCKNGVCKGTPFTCLSCQRCNGDGACTVKPNFCLIDKRCYNPGDLRPGKPCQDCHSGSHSKWSANNSLSCTDNNEKTRNDRCRNGECRGESFTCLSCQYHHKDTCLIKTGYCLIKDKGVDTCYAATTRKPGNPCQWCLPKKSNAIWSNKDNVPCDDGDSCTRSDTCKDGLCVGERFKCDGNCQTCNGRDCSLLTGYGYVAGKCTCKIGGKDYNHQDVNPNNQCQWCDIYDRQSKSSLSWSNRPSGKCNDNNACTKNDACKDGYCKGETYSCQTSYPQSSCIETSKCKGDGTCTYIMKSSGTICRPAVDQCDKPERCNGVTGACPPSYISPIHLQEGQARLTLPNFATSIAFQSSTDKLHLQLAGFTVTCGSLAVRWSLIKNRDSCLLGKHNAKLASNTNNHILAGLNLKNTDTYKVVVQGNNIRGESGQPVCSSPITIDTSTPTSGWVNDGLGSRDLQYVSSKSISATWGGFRSTYGIGKYEVAMYYTQFPSDNLIRIQTFVNVNLNVSFTKTVAVIPDGSNVTTILRAFTKAGLYTQVTSNGVTVDTSRPLSGSVSDGLNISFDLDYADWTSIYTASWEPFTDPHTPIVNYNIGVKRKSGGFVSSGVEAVGIVYRFVVQGISLVSGEEYCVVVEGENAAGLKTQAYSNCLLIDHDAPRPGTVNDGTSNDIDYQSGDTVFHANWNGFDDGFRGSGLREYKYILTDQNDVNITSWIPAGLETNVTISGINLGDGIIYYITVRAIDRVGHSKEVKSDGVYIDKTHPVFTGKIIVYGETSQKRNLTVVYISNEGSVTASWPQFVDEHSGMKKYLWRIVKNREEGIEWKDVPGRNLATRAVFRDLLLTNNTGYRLSIRGINNAGLHTDITSDILIPIGAPGIGTVFDGHNASVDIDYITYTSEVYASWQGFERPDVKIRAYFLAIGSCSKSNYHVTNNQFIPVRPPTSTSFGVQGLRLVTGQKYCVKIKAQNLAGVESDTASSDGFTVDVSPPDLKLAMVLDGPGEDDIDYQSSKTQMSATWTGIQDRESGIQHFEVAVSRNRAGQPDVTSFKDIGHNMSSVITGLNLNNEVYYIILCAINNAGLKSCFASDGVLIDPTPPSTGVVHDGILEPDIQYQACSSKMSANWERIWDLESRIDRFEWGIGEEKEGLVQEFVDVGLQTHVTSKQHLDLKHGFNYTVLLRAYNRAGSFKELSSNGVIIDTTAPIPSEIIPKLTPLEWRFCKETKTYYSSNATGIYVTWENFEEQENKLWYYKWGLGISKYGTQLQPLINIGLVTNANTSTNELNIRPGIKYYVTVIARNRANLVAGNCSWPFLIDYSPPRTGNVQITTVSRVQKEYFRSGENMRVRWSGFEDLESGIEKYEISVLHNDTGLLSYTINSNNGEHEMQIDTGLLLAGQTFKIVVKSFNYAGLASFVTSTPFTVDNTPPFYTGNKDELPRRHFASDPHLLQVLWEDFKDDESPIEFYEIGIGTQASSDDIYKFTKNVLCTHFSFPGLDTTDNQTYYVTIKAHNLAGIATLLLLEEIIFDQSPPSGNDESVKDGLAREDIDYVPLQNAVSATLDHADDLESGISKIEYCVGSTPFNCVIKRYTSIHHNKSFVCTDCKVDAGMTAFAKFRVTNGAGLSSIFVSDGVTVDSTPPEIQIVYDGKKVEYPDVEATYNNWTPTVTWYGARDIQSGLRNCQWIIIKKEGNKSISVYEKALHKANTTYSVRHTEKAAHQLTLTTNSSYFNVIQCWNHAGMTSHRYSNGWSVVEQWPIPSYVVDGKGPHDIDYDVNGKHLEASWGAFHADSKDPVVKYEFAVGTAGEIDNVMEFTDVGLDIKVSLLLSESGIILKSGVEYFVTVRGTTLTGWAASKTSNGIIVDTTSPSGGIVKFSHHILNQNTNEVDYTLSWKDFVDSETGIQSYEYCLGYIRDVCSTTVFNAGLAFQGTVRGFVPEASSFYGIVVVTNRAGLKTIISSDAVNIDFSPPVIGDVLDGIDIDLDYINTSFALTTTWSSFRDLESGIKTCTLTIIEESHADNKSLTLKLKRDVNATGSITHGFALISGFQYVATVTCENRDGFKSSKSSNGVIVNESPPIAGKILDKNDQPFAKQYQSSTNELHVRWTDAYDRESGIKEYLIAVGSGSNDDNVREFFSVGLAREIKIKDLTLSSGVTYYVTLQIVNKAGVASRVSSNGITVDETPPKICEVNIQPPGYIGPGDGLKGNWKTFDDESDIDFAQYCFGTTRGECNVQGMHRAVKKEMNVTCFQCALIHRYTYFMTVRVWNKAGLFNVATSGGVMVDFTGPVGGKMSLNKTYISCVDRCSLMAEFSSSEDEESGVGSCEFSIRTMNDEILTFVQPKSNEALIEANDLSLKHGESYTIAMVCYNTVGGRGADVFSPPILVDNTPPEKGFVIVSPDGNHDVRRQHVGCHLFNTTLRVYWSQFHDKESRIAGFRVAIGRRPLEPDIIPYTYVGIVTDASFHLSQYYGLSLGETIFATVEATNEAGLSSKLASRPTRLISDNPDFSEEDFMCVDV